MVAVFAIRLMIRKDQKVWQYLMLGTGQKPNQNTDVSNSTLSEVKTHFCQHARMIDLIYNLLHVHTLDIVKLQDSGD